MTWGLQGSKPGVPNCTEKLGPSHFTSGLDVAGGVVASKWPWRDWRHLSQNKFLGFSNPLGSSPRWLLPKETLCASPRGLSRGLVLVQSCSHTPILRSQSHKVTALDLAASGINPKQVSNVKSYTDYFKPLIDVMDKLPKKERVILVGHSLGGLAISHAMETFPHKVAVAVFVTAEMPSPPSNFSNTGRKLPPMDNKFSYEDGPNKPPTIFSFGPKFLASNVYNLSPIEDFILATTLVRAVRLVSLEEVWKEIVLSDEKYGSVRRVFVVSGEDKLIDEGVLRRWLKDNPPDLVLEIKGSDHMVMFSKPKELSSGLHNISKIYL
ncbi:hypothetical protein Sjap_010127 [Stephania japonica]|uniref:AB hydrolase-1 domain-containing protein n=1 Tax=Stephania japonica TaxID=461633 RepID=A0AAP0P640_9MAGN